MSTLPNDTSRDVAAENQVPVIAVAPFDRQVDDAVREFESGAQWLGVPRPPTAELRELCRKVAAFTAELFPAGLTIKVRNDPEIADDLHFVFDVATSGDVDEIVARDNEWHFRLRREVGGRAELFCLVY